MNINTNPAQFQRFLELIPIELMPNIWFIPLGKGIKKPDIPKGEEAKDEKYRLTPEQALDKIKKGFNVGIYATSEGLLFLDTDTNKGNIVLPEKIRNTIPSTLTIKTRNGGLQYYFINNGTFKNKIHTYEGRKAGEIRVDWYYVVAPGSYVKPDEDAGQDADGVYRIINDAPIIKLDKLPEGITIKDDIPKKEIEIETAHIWKNDLGISLEDIRKKDEKLDKLLSGACELNYPSRSEADLGAAQKLYWWRFNDSEIARIIKEYRPYEKTARKDYLETTISKITSGERYKENGANHDYEPEKLPEQAEAIQERRIKLELPDDHFISQYVKWGESVSDAFREYHIVNGLWLLSAATNRNVVLKLKQEYVRPNLWIMTLGNSTTSRKSTAVNKARKIFECATEQSLPNDDFSLEGYLESLAHAPIMHNVRDEASGLMAKFHQRYNDGIFDLECTIYDGSPDVLQKRLSSGKSKEPKTYRIEKYYVTKLYATTPDKLAHCMAIDDFMCGYGYRWIYNFPKYKHDRKPLAMEEKEDVEAWMKISGRIRDFYNIFKGGNEQEFSIDKEVFKYYDDICLEIEAKASEQNNDILDSIIGRAEIHILKIAMLLELGKSTPSRKITEESIKNASEMVINYFIPSIMEIIERLQEDIKNNLIERIIAILRRVGGVGSHTKLLRDSHIKSREFQECINTMLESQRIKIEHEKPRIYKLISHNTPLNLRNVREVRNVRTYTEDDNTYAKNAKMISIDACTPSTPSLRTCEPCEQSEQSEQNNITDSNNSQQELIQHIRAELLTQNKHFPEGINEFLIAAQAHRWDGATEERIITAITHLIERGSIQVISQDDKGIRRVKWAGG